MNDRLHQLRKLLVEQNLDAVFISSLSNIIYLTNFSHFTTLDRDGYLLITKNNQFIFTHGIYKEDVEKNVKNFTLISIQREKPISQSVAKIIQSENIKKLGFEAFDLKVSEYDELVKEIGKNYLVACDIVKQLRIHKDPEEITAIKKACDLGDKAYSYILKKIRVNMTEIEIAYVLEMFIKKNSASLSFDSVIAFGENASKPHHVPSKTKLKNNSFVLLDFGVKIDNYCSDMTRTIFFGNAITVQKKAYQSVLKSQLAAITFIQDSLKAKQKIIAKNVDSVSREYLIQNGYASMPHSLGHGIGLQVHESPRLSMFSDEIIKNGMVFSLEPGIYLPGKFGIRIEDLFVIKNDKLIPLTTSSKQFTQI